MEPVIPWVPIPFKEAATGSPHDIKSNRCIDFKKKKKKKKKTKRSSVTKLDLREDSVIIVKSSRKLYIRGKLVPLC